MKLYWRVVVNQYGIRKVHRNLLLKHNELQFKANSPYSKLNKQAPQKLSTSTNFQSESESDSEYVLLYRSFKCRRMLLLSSMGWKERPMEINNVTYSGGLMEPKAMSHNFKYPTVFCQTSKKIISLNLF